MKRKYVVAACLTALVALTFLSAVPVVFAGEMFDCAPDSKIEKMIAKDAKLTEFSCYYEKWKGAKALHFKVGVKNLAKEPMRFRVNIFLDNGKAVGGLIPRKTKKGLVKPGETASFAYPVKGMTEKPKEIILRVTTMSK
jgi:hypothetical protein